MHKTTHYVLFVGHGKKYRPLSGMDAASIANTTRQVRLRRSFPEGKAQDSIVLTSTQVGDFCPLARRAGVHHVIGHCVLECSEAALAKLGNLDSRSCLHFALRRKVYPAKVRRQANLASWSSLHENFISSNSNETPDCRQRAFCIVSQRIAGRNSRPMQPAGGVYSSRIDLFSPVSRKAGWQATSKKSIFVSSGGDAAPALSGRICSPRYVSCTIR